MELIFSVVRTTQHQMTCWLVNNELEKMGKEEVAQFRDYSGNCLEGPSKTMKNVNTLFLVGFEVFTAVVMKSIIFWDMTQCSPSSFNRRFGEAYRLHLQGRRNKFSKNQQASKQICWVFLNLFLRPWRWRRYVPPKRRLKLDGLHGVYPRRWYSSLCVSAEVQTGNLLNTNQKSHFFSQQAQFNILKKYKY
jgi:hypothetical protein